jgi:uncharacterized protein (UPF0254 family)
MERHNEHRGTHDGHTYRAHAQREESKMHAHAIKRDANYIHTRTKHTRTTRNAICIHPSNTWNCFLVSSKLERKKKEKENEIRKRKKEVYQEKERKRTRKKKTKEKEHELP